ncbi:helix-turn-helix domain-containing protein [Geodermatophilus marinus]|uniref:helix-turn-helix domain-containing protein n=1 Tax=Geodermatophilus sp. LHW52908 TaxID=2303986 RepID=UPI000E3E7957|nr:helix-turn-helix domain-containing protein [Geodermatophilus sp. LHW52908]RFU20592.1 helix-turn-helix domain-containing protein [Geodermatophilus sp. LHW52908]
MSATRTCPACGYSSTYASDALADLHHARHSCAKHQRATERTRRRVQRAQSRVRRDCTHPRARHVHGTRAAYVKDRCRCTDCTAANTASGRAVHRAQTFGRWRPFVDAAPVREHLRALRAAGIGVEQIAMLAGLSTSHVRELANPGRDGNPGIRRVRPETAHQVLRVRVDEANRAPRSHVGATGTRRRLQALIAIGWPHDELAARLGRNSAGLRRSMLSDAVTARTAQDVTALYEQLWNLRPPHSTDDQRAAADAARAFAAERGWLPPLAWDDIDTDPEPQHHARRVEKDDDLDEIAIERALAGDGVRLEHLTLAEQDEVVRRLTERGESIRDIARQLATTKRTISRRRASINAA